jgi:hypothetical protein
MSIAKQLVTTGLATAAISVAIIAALPQAPAQAGGLRNEKISDITNDDLLNYCRGKLPRTTGEVSFIRGSRNVSCQAGVQETASTAASASSRARVTARRRGVNGKLSIKTNVNGTFTANITSRQASYRLTDYCREVVDRSWFNPFTGEGRVFVADGGYSCHKTVRE